MCRVQDQTRLLFALPNRFYGKALPLEELDLQFCGELPAETLNEQEVPTSRREQLDPLKTNEFVKALKVQVNEYLGFTSELKQRSWGCRCFPMFTSQTADNHEDAAKEAPAVAPHEVLAGWKNAELSLSLLAHSFCKMESCS